MVNLKESDQRKTSMHEAGHAVIAYRYGHSHMDVTITPEKEKDGCCRIWGGITQNEPIEDIKILLAGHAAQMLCDPDDKHEPSVTDYRNVWRILERYSITSERYLQLIDETSRMVEENYKQMVAVSDALMETKSLNAGLVGEIISAIDDGKNWRDCEAWTIAKQFYNQYPETE